MSRATPSPATPDADIDQLYQVPLGEFTAARNALAKARGTAGADIKALEKPSLAAWGVNQLYWQERGSWDRLLAAAVAMRDAHVRTISGRQADIAAAEAAHNSARRTAAELTRRLIEAAGEKATPATLDAVAETLQALPSDDMVPGRLTRPLKPLGFGALMAMGISPQSAVRGPQSAVPGPQSTVRGSQSAARKAAQKALRAAEAEEARAEAALADAEKAALKAERELAGLRDKLTFLEKQRDDTEAAVRKHTRALQDAANARLQAAQDLDDI